MAKTCLIMAGAALAEIAGCFAFWSWLRLDKSALWLLPGAGAAIALAGASVIQFGPRG